ncbi:MAG: hypothetical protein GWN94_11320 [Phycisphaerae bacterium]|nr:hypothetical protein [Phycisphaerae bacterium]
MKIKWIGGMRMIPRLGILQYGDVRVVPDDIAKGFIKQGLARKFIVKRNKQKETKQEK